MEIKAWEISHQNLCVHSIPDALCHLSTAARLSFERAAACCTKTKAEYVEVMAIFKKLGLAATWDRISELRVCLLKGQPVAHKDWRRNFIAIFKHMRKQLWHGICSLCVSLMKGQPVAQRREEET